MLEERIRRTMEQVRTFIADKPDAWALPEEAAEFLYAWILASGAKRGLEIGTSYGWSGLWLGAALRANNGGLITVDVEPRKSHVALQYFQEAGLTTNIEVVTGDAASVIKDLIGPFDFVLNDADKARSRQYFDLLLGKMIPRAVFISDNALSHPGSFDGFLEYVRSREDFYCLTVPIGNGFEIAVKLG